MTEEEKQLVLIDLSARLQHGVKLDFYSKATKEHYVSTLLGIEPDGDRPIIAKVEDGAYTLGLDHIKPYLRPISSMTVEERFYYNGLCNEVADFHWEIISYKIYDWLNKHHFDYRGLIEKGLALEAPKDMYKIK